MPKFISQHMEILEKYQLDIVALELTDISPANVVIVDVPIKDHKAVPGTPCVLISPMGTEGYNPTAGTNVEDDIVFPAFVTIVDAANQEINPKVLDKRLYWREKIRDHFIMTRLTLTNVTVHQVTWSPLLVVDMPAWFETNSWVSAMRFNNQARITRRA